MNRSLCLIASGFALTLAACGGDDGGGGDAIDAPPGSSVRISGTAQTVQGTTASPLAGAMIAAYERGNTTPVAMTTSAADGKYMLDLSTANGPVDGYLKGTSAGKLDTYLYPPIPLTADRDGATMLIVTQQTFDLLATLGGATQATDKGFIGLLVTDAAGAPLAGATVTVSPAGTSKVVYANGMIPSANATMTDAMGTVYIFNVTAGEATVDATMGGTAFREHAVTVRTGVITTTALQP